jgi:hypothetical protein
MKQFLRDHGLTLTMFGLFLIFLACQALTGFRAHNQELSDHSQPKIDFGSYLTSGHFIESTFENWEIEYLQMGFYVALTAFLYQRGSAESKDPAKQEPVDENPRFAMDRSDAPWPVRRGGLALAIYEHSLTLALFLLFAFSFVMHLYGGARKFSEMQIAHGGSRISTAAFAGTAEFWFQSFQNWQSEFLAVASLAWLSIRLRQRGSPESKPVAAAHRETGS